MSELHQGEEPKRYTVVVECAPPDAGTPNFPTCAYVLPTPQLSQNDYDGIRAAAEKGGCSVRIFTVGNIGVEELKHRLMRYGATTLD